MIPALSPTGTVYIANIVSWQLRQQEKEVEMTPTVTKPYPAWIRSVPSLPNFKMPDDKMFSGLGNPNQQIVHYMLRCMPVIWNNNHERCTISAAFHAITRGRSLHLVRKCPRKFYRQLAGDGTRIPDKVLQHLKEVWSARTDWNKVEAEWELYWLHPRWSRLTFVCPQNFT